jgi:hypothetical protein
MKYFLPLLMFLSGLLVPGVSLALEVPHPQDGAANIPIGKSESYFSWQAVPGATKYVLDVVQFTQSEDNVPPSVCSGGGCFFQFLQLSVGNIEYADSYTWRVTAYNASGNPISATPLSTFTTAQAPSIIVPPGGGGGPKTPPPAFPLENPISSKSLPELLENVLNFLFGLSIIILPIIILYGGLLLLTAAGDPEKVSKARTILLWAVIAFAVILIARGLPAVLRNLL